MPCIADVVCALYEDARRHRKVPRPHKVGFNIKVPPPYARPWSAEQQRLPVNPFCRAYTSATHNRATLEALRLAGWRMRVSASSKTRSPGFPYAIDNGAWSAHLHKKPFDTGAFSAILDELGSGADWVVAPDIVEGGMASLHLSESWLPRRVKPTHLEAQNSDRPTSEPSIAQLTKWVSALEPDSEPAQQAAHMLTQGQMVWLADLAPGVPMRIVREDAWRNDLDRRAQLEKGAMLRVELNLPNLGRIRVVGSQWGQDLSLQIAHDASSQDQWTRLAPSLLNDLQAQGIGEVRFETLSKVEEGPNGQRTA